MTDANALDDVILVAKYRDQFRWTINPPSRRAGNAVWSVGPAEEWCEVASLSNLDRARKVIRRLERENPRGEEERPLHRLQRQEMAHSTQICLRDGRHWGEDA